MIEDHASATLGDSKGAPEPKAVKVWVGLDGDGRVVAAATVDSGENPSKWVRQGLHVLLVDGPVTMLMKLPEPKTPPEPYVDMAKLKKPTQKELQRGIARKRLQTEAHLGMPIAEWRLKKRQQWRTVMNAINLFAYGSAYTPTGNDFYELQKSADRIKESMSDDWVCW